MKWSTESKHKGLCQPGAIFAENDTHKIVYYHYLGANPVAEGTKGAVKGYHAYFKPSGWLNFGNNVKRRGLDYFESLADAKAACVDHLKEYGPNPYDSCRFV